MTNLVKESIKTGHTPSMKNSDYYGGDIRFIKTDNLRDNIIQGPFSHHLSLLGNDEIRQTQLKENDIITTVIGASYDVIARSCILHAEDLPANINQNIALIRINTNKINSNYLCAYLNSKYGKMYLEYLSRQTEQINLNCQEIGRVIVPIFSPDFQNYISKLITIAYNSNLKSRHIYNEAKIYLSEHLQISKSITNNSHCNIKTNKNSFLLFNRLDAEYYQPQYDEIVDKISQYPLGQDTIGNLFILRDRNFLPDNDIQYKYIELSNIGANGEILGYTYEYGSNLPSRARRIVHTGDVIISSIEGSLQSCAIVTDEYDGALCSTGFYILTPRIINSETSLILFKSAAVQALLKRACTGTILTAINKDEFINISLPAINKDIQNEIANIIQKSTTLRKESKRLLDLAKTAVETAIEKGEDEAIKLFSI
ncbi:MAG: hypothetical protein NC250_06590 [Alistipes senegalensis]|nr:hypothetical protein [Alistipes senegalensis]